MSIIGSKERPLRCSKLASIIKCSVRVAMLERMGVEDDEGSPAAQTGSLTHAGVAAFHKAQKESLLTRKKEAWDAIARSRHLFPLADETEVRLLITPYMDDSRNIEANCIAVEEQIEFTLPPHEIDQTCQPIYVQGTVDQIRRIDSINYVYDYKTGKKTGWEMIHDYAIQLIAYTCGANQKYGLTHVGKIIRGMSYRTRNAGAEPNDVFWQIPVSDQDIPLILESVRFHVGMLRNRDAQFGPGPHCTYCEFGGLMNCIPRFKGLFIIK